MQPFQANNLCGVVAEGVAAINIHLETMFVGVHHVEGRVISEASLVNLDNSLFNSSSSFQGFPKPANLGDRSRSVMPKVKSLKKEDLPKSSRPQRSNPPAPSRSAPSRSSPAPKPLPSTSKATPPYRGRSPEIQSLSLHSLALTLRPLSIYFCRKSTRW